MSYVLDIAIHSAARMPDSLDAAIDEAIVALHERLSPGCQSLHLRRDWPRNGRVGWLRPADDRDIDTFAEWAAALASAHPTLAVKVSDLYGTVFVQSDLAPGTTLPEAAVVEAPKPVRPVAPNPLPEAIGRVMLDDDWRPQDRSEAGAHVSELTLLHPSTTTSASYHPGGGPPIMVVEQRKRMLDASGAPLRTGSVRNYPTHLSAPNYDYKCGIGYYSPWDPLPGAVAMELDFHFGLETELDIPVEATRRGSHWTFRASPPLDQGYVIFGMHVRWFDADGQRIGTGSSGDTFLTPWETEGRYVPDVLVLGESCHGARSTVVRVVGARLDGPVHRFGWSLPCPLS